MAKLMGNKMILGAAVGILGGLVVAVLLVVVLGVGGSPAAAEAPKESAAAAKKEPAKAAKGAAAAEPRFGPTFHIKDRIVNLADPGARRYLRFSVALEFAPHEDPSKKASLAPTDGGFQLALYEPELDAHGAQPTSGGGKADPDKEFQAQIKKYAPALEDVVTTVLSSKTVEEIRTVDGKELVKKEIKDRCQRLLGDAEHITNVYFTEFVIQ